MNYRDPLVDMLTLTENELVQLISQGERLEIEFKSDRRQISDAEIVETVACMANMPQYPHGWVFIGVEDDGTITGARNRHGDTTDSNRISALIANKTNPSVATDIAVIEIEGKPIIAIKVITSRIPIGTNDGVYKKRVPKHDGSPECRAYSIHELTSQSSTAFGGDFSARVVSDASWADLDPLEFVRFRKILANTRNGERALLEYDDLDLATNLGVVERGPDGSVKVKTVALLLFGKQSILKSCIPTHVFAFQTFTGTQIGNNETFSTPLLNIWEDIVSRFNARNNMAEMMVKTQRLSIPDYSPEGFREALANALIHRDYQVNNAIYLQWYKEYIQLSSPGRFPDGVRLENLLITPPTPRNMLLSEVFKRLGLAEKSSRGIDRIYEEQLKFGRPVPDYSQTSEANVVLVIPGGQANLAFTKFCIEAGITEVVDLLILNTLWLNHRISVEDASRLTQRGVDFVRGILEKLVTKNTLIAEGYPPSRLYELNPEIRQKFEMEAQEPLKTVSTPQNIGAFTDEEAKAPRNIGVTPQKQDVNSSKLIPGTSITIEPLVSDPTMVRLLEIAEPAWTYSHLPKEMMKELILKLCQDDWRTPKTLVKVLRRKNQNSLFLGELVAEGLLKQKYSGTPTHPKQAYRATEKALLLLASHYG